MVQLLFGPSLTNYCSVPDCAELLSIISANCRQRLAGDCVAAFRWSQAVSGTGSGIPVAWNRITESAVPFLFPHYAWRTRNRSGSHVPARRRSCPGPEKVSPPRHVPRPREEYVVVVHGAATRAGPIPSPDEGKGWKRICRAAHGAGPPRGLHSIFSSLPIGWCRTAQLVGRGRASRVCVWPAPPVGRAPRFQRDHDCLLTNRSSRDGCVDSTKTCAGVCVCGRRQAGTRRG
jgi:hypothetical protein